ncbi:MAG: septal ring lytic transglycosylase RlpA family protein [Candidatus Binatus sp.]|nr:septal ring lytic transglycosylase RlpA family protein [Candidatus Binatus sp.]MDO8433357.1 septal ring lytic transglycosylase RlpA family protein [Candidatus Binatus sp.]
MEFVPALNRDSRAACESRAKLAYFKPSLDCPAFAVAAMLAFAIAGCSARSNVPSYYQPLPHPHERTEVASWYGPGFVGRRTSTGERFNPNALTAASKTLPIGSHVKVTNPSTGKSVVVRINDRGPHRRGRTLDLSRRAAQEIGITKKGVARVRVASMTGGGDEAAPASRRSRVGADAADEPRRSRRRSQTKVRRNPPRAGIIKAEDIE